MFNFGGGLLNISGIIEPKNSICMSMREHDSVDVLDSKFRKTGDSGFACCLAAIDKHCLASQTDEGGDVASSVGSGGVFDGIVAGLAEELLAWANDAGYARKSC